MATLIDAPTATRAAYQGWDKQWINGSWRTGKSRHVVKDVDPFTGETLVEIPAADTQDLDAAYRGAREAARAARELLVQPGGIDRFTIHVPDELRATMIALSRGIMAASKARIPVECLLRPSVACDSPATQTPLTHRCASLMMSAERNRHDRGR